jgi:hypothetical protein
MYASAHASAGGEISVVGHASESNVPLGESAPTSKAEQSTRTEQPSRVSSAATSDLCLGRLQLAQPPRAVIFTTEIALSWIVHKPSEWLDWVCSFPLGLWSGMDGYAKLLRIVSSCFNNGECRLGLPGRAPRNALEGSVQTSGHRH